MIGQTVSHYHILGKLGGGGMGVVYRGEDTRLGRPVALKFLPEKYFGNIRAQERFQREARAASALNHPNICTVHDIGEHAGQPFIVMEYLQGKSLKQYLATEPMDLKKRIEIAKQVSEGLQAAHSEGIVHRDIKPANIFVTASGLVKLVDFGLAKSVDEPGFRSVTTQSMKESVDGPLTAPGTLVGTIRYMSPEQALGQQVDARSDIFSLGVVLYEMTTGQPPFIGKTVAAFFEALIHCSPRPPRSLNPRISSGIESVILKSLEKDPARRYQRASEFRSELLKAPDRRHWLPYPVRRWSVRSVSFLIAVAVLALFFGQKDPNWFDNIWPFGTETQDVAVLPFETSGLDPDKEEAWRGLFKELTSSLTRMQQFDRTLSLVSAREIADMGVTSPSEANRFYGATLAVDGMVEWTGIDLRITLNLTDAVNLRQLDSELVVDTERDFLSVKPRVLAALVTMLKVNLEPQTFSVLAATGTTVSQAYDHYLRGLEYLERSDVTGNLERAIGELRLAVEADPTFAKAHAALTRAFARQFGETNETGWLDDARESCEQAMLLNSRLPETLTGCALLDATEGRYEKAADGYRTAITLDSTNSEAYRRLAFVLAKLGQHDEAESIFTAAIELKPDHWVGYYELGTFYLIDGRFEEAIEPLRSALGHVPENYQIYGNIGSAFFHLGRLSEALEYYLVSAEIKPNYRALSNLGSIYFHQGKFGEAAERYEAALELSGSDYAVWGNLALACSKIPERAGEAAGYYDKAAKLAESRLQVNSKDIEVTIHLADYYLELGRSEDGSRLLEAALELPTENPDLKARIGGLFERLGDRKQAIDWILNALESGYPRDRLETSSGLEELRKDAEFQRRLKALETEDESEVTN